MKNNYGNFIRLLMYNHNKNNTTKKMEIKDKFKIKNSEVLELINYTKENIKVLNLELVGIEKNKVVDPMNSEKYTLRRLSCNSENLKPENIDKKLIIIFTFITLEGNQITQNKIKYLCGKVSLFENDNIDFYLQYLKRCDYISILKIDDEMVVELGYKYYVEYGDVNIIDTLKQICQK